MSGFRDHFSGLAELYRSARPQYPDALFAALATAARGRSVAWDCGTGNGQAAIGLAHHFDHVIATDGSAKQIERAEPHPKNEYRVARAEQSGLEPAGVDLVLVAQALHWFDLDRFYKEVRRVLKPRGIIAATCYFNPHLDDPNADEVFQRIRTTLQPFFPPGREHVDDGYRSLPFPFEPLAVPPIAFTRVCDLAWLLGYIASWSATQRYQACGGSLDAPASELAEAWGEPATQRTLKWEFNVRAGAPITSG
jgi:SAM-dependent methyltransferase